MDIPNPGSDEAIDMGCKCPVLDNGHGRGSFWGPNTFIYTEGCPVHKWPPADPEAKDPEEKRDD